MRESAAACRNRIIAIKLLHTFVWALIAGCIIALPVLAFSRQFGWALILSIVIVAECLVLGANRNRCPLTDWAAQYTDDRADNFDIYLPNWLAKHNKLIFGSLFVVNEVVVIWRWLTHP
jgi:hypothetical protein